jgi:ABC-type phosphate/phosphonate transport system substrate-binding protein
VLSHVIAAYAKLVPEDTVMWAEDMQRDFVSRLTFVMTSGV